MNEHQVQHWINIILHVLILFTFLSIFFFTYISKIEKKTIKNELNTMIQQNINNILSKIKEKFPSINLNTVNDISTKIIEDSKTNKLDVDTHNKKLLYSSIGIISGLIVILLGLIMFFKFYKGYDLSLGKILITNLIIFLFVGIIEFGFFIIIILKYIPVTPDVAVISMIDRIKYNINNIVK